MVDMIDRMVYTYLDLHTHLLQLRDSALHFVPLSHIVVSNRRCCAIEQVEVLAYRTRHATARDAMRVDTSSRTFHESPAPVFFFGIRTKSCVL